MDSSVVSRKHFLGYAVDNQQTRVADEIRWKAQVGLSPDIFWRIGTTFGKNCTKHGKYTRQAPSFIQHLGRQIHET